MTKKKKKTKYSKYLRTAFVTFVVLVCVATAMLIWAGIHVELGGTEEEVAMQNDMVGFLISKYKHEEKKDPTNASINLKLGQLYELIEAYKPAENEYVLAIRKRNGTFEAAAFRLAGVKLLQKEFDIAEHLVADIHDSPRYSILKGKADFYKSYGDALYNEGQFVEAVLQYSRALTYYKKLGSSSVKNVERLKCDAHVAYADELVMTGSPIKALVLLNKVEEECRSPLLTYKLGLLNIERQPTHAVELFEDVQKRSPELINYNLYKKLLFGLKLHYVAEGDRIRSELYDIKLVRLKSFMAKNILTADDVSLTNYDFRLKKFRMRNEYDVIYSFDAHNISHDDISSLIAIVEFYDEDGRRIHRYVQTIASRQKPLVAAAKATPIKVVVRTKKNLIQQYGKIYSRVLLSKNPKMSTQLYFTQEFEVTKGKNKK